MFLLLLYKDYRNTHIKTTFCRTEHRKARIQTTFVAPKISQTRIRATFVTPKISQTRIRATCPTPKIRKTCIKQYHLHRNNVFIELVSGNALFCRTESLPLMRILERNSLRGHRREARGRHKQRSAKGRGASGAQTCPNLTFFDNELCVFWFGFVLLRFDV